jgi:hypothetical protein
MPLATDDTRSPEASSGTRPPRRRALRVALVLTLVLAVVVGVCAVLIVRDAYAARDALDEAAATVPAVEQAIREGLTDPEAATTPLVETPALRDLQESTRTAREATDGWLWTVAAELPRVGPSVAAAATVSAVIDDVADIALPALALTADAIRATPADDGRLDLAPLAAAADDVTAARADLAGSSATLAQIDPTRIQDGFADPVRDLQRQLADLDGMLAGAERATTLLPPMLGADESRRYVVLGLSNAELRAAGGIPGALTELEIESGAITVGTQAAGTDVGPFRRPVLPLDPEDVAAYTTRLGRFVQDVTLTPDFATTAPLAAEMWRRAQGEEVDGVLATDPVALSYLLDATGPVTVPLPADLAAALGGTEEVVVESSTVVDLLLRRTYDALDAEQADAFFAVVAGAVLDELTAGDVAPTALLPAVERAAREHRLNIWSAHPEEQAALAGTLVAATWDDDRARDAVGVFLDDLVVGKLSAYLDVQVALGESVCTETGRSDTVEVTLRNRLDAGTVQGLPDYVAGPPDDPDRGRMLLNVSTYGTRGDDLPRLTRDGGTVGGDTVRVGGRNRVAITVGLDPGESTVVGFTVPASAEAARGEGAALPGTLEVWSTPTVSAPGLQVLDVPVCG